MKYLLSMFFCIVFVGCETTQSPTGVLNPPAVSSAEQDLINALPFIQSGARLAGSVAINFGVSDSDKIVKSKCIYGLAHALYVATGGTLPTTQELEALLQSFAISDGQVYLSLISSVTDIYETYFAKIQGNAKLGVLVLNALAGGLEQAAAQYIPPAS